MANAKLRCLWLATWALLTCESCLGEVWAGVGIADVTGPAAEVGMMGYAQYSQKTSGIHTRLFSRAFVFASLDSDANANSSSSSSRVAYVVVDAGMIGQLVKMRVVDRLRARFGPSVYTHRNVVLSATHTHAGPGGFLQYVLFNITTLGFVKQSFWALVDGIVKSIVLAHASLEPARLTLAQSELLRTNINRSPTSYMANHKAEREKYSGDTDATMTQLVIFSSASGQPFGLVNWFAVHGTSMNNTNKLISSDNKGVASIMFEKKINGDRPLGKGPFVAAFATANLGDVSPNTRGSQCRDTGLPCDSQWSTCGGGSGMECIAFGPGKDMFDSTKIIGERQFNRAYEMFLDPVSQRPLIGDEISFAHQWIDMSDRAVTVGGVPARTCSPALGYSFAAGTTDGPGEANYFIQGTREPNPFWRVITNAIKAPSESQIRCHHPKPILLNTGKMSEGASIWSPSIVDTQVIRVGNLVIAALPGEFTTMAGRRLRETVEGVATSHGLADATVVLSGLSNMYSSYVTTFEEYQMQRYEAASTLYGPHTLTAYLDQYRVLTKSMLTGVPLRSSVSPPDLYESQVSLDTPPIMDAPTIGSTGFGHCKRQPPATVVQGETVAATFVSGHPRNNLMLGGTFLTVEMERPDGNWTVVATDADWETRFIWKRLMFAESEARVLWSVPAHQEPGNYRIRHFGHFKTLGVKGSKPYDGETLPFKVLDSSSSLRRGRRLGGGGGGGRRRKSGGGLLQSVASVFRRAFG